VEDDIYGDGVNVASRIEGLAPPGGICLSKTVVDQVQDKLDLAFEDMGERRVKNIARPIRVMRVRLGGEGRGPTAAARPRRLHRRFPRLGLRPAWLIWVLALLLALGAGYEVWRYTHRPAPPALMAGGPSVVVLPFADLTGDAQQASLADGVTEDIVSQLAQVG